jgi:hypothetical protein
MTAHPLTLTGHERDNVLALLLAAAGAAGPSPLAVADTGDWLAAVISKLDGGGGTTLPDRSPEQLVRAANSYQARARAVGHPTPRAVLHKTRPGSGAGHSNGRSSSPAREPQGRVSRS